MKKFLDKGRIEPEEMERLISECKSVKDTLVRAVALWAKSVPEDSGMTITDGME